MVDPYKENPIYWMITYGETNGKSWISQPSSGYSLGWSADERKGQSLICAVPSFRTRGTPCRLSISTTRTVGYHTPNVHQLSTMNGNMFASSLPIPSCALARSTPRSWMVLAIPLASWTPPILDGGLASEWPFFLSIRTLTINQINNQNQPTINPYHNPYQLLFAQFTYQHE